MRTVYPGEAYSCRLGNDNTGAEGEEIMYGISVNSNSYLFIYSYAVVLQDPNHSASEQPSFTIEIRNAAGQVVDSTCGYYYVTAQSGLPGWGNCSNTSATWRDWTTVGMNLSQYAGQMMKIVFITRDCSLGRPLRVCVSEYILCLPPDAGSLCQDDTVAILTAPAGFTYLWSTGETGNSITIPNPVTGTSYNCIITSYNGCQDTIYQTLSYTVVHTDFTMTSNCATLPAQFHDASTINQNYVTNWEWDFGDGSPIVSGNPNPTHAFPAPGPYLVKLKSYSTEGCVDSIEHTIVIDSLPHLTNTPLHHPALPQLNAEP